MAPPVPRATPVAFEFATATRIVFGAGMASEAGAAVAGIGTRALLVTGRDSSRAVAVAKALREAGVAFRTEAVDAEPTVEWLREAVGRTRAEHCDAVVACGGGSAIDAGKALAAMLANPGDVLNYLEVIGQGRALPNASVPLFAIPTTAGTGAEVTRNAVLGSREHGVKASLRSAGMLPALAIVDPVLSLGLPPALTACTGLDALTQLIEPFVCRKANPMSDAFCREGIPRVARSLRQACEQGQDLEARSDMAMASLLSGLALANAGLGAVHGFAAPVGGAFPAPHGAVCAALLPHAMRANLHALNEREPDAEALERYREVAAMLTGDAGAVAEDGLQWVEALCRDLAIPRLGHWGVGANDVRSLTEKAAKASSMKANAIALTHTEMEALLLAAI
ncbi:MAG: iron-containing alcohol dehydrogenase [Bryobacterales bacterium]|nr:iron-containing alcohol dehydrogenase [Bryobacterales bacterium]